MPFDAIISILVMLVCLVGLVHVVIAYRQTTRSAEPDPERVKRFVESAPPIQAPLIDASMASSPEVTSPRDLRESARDCLMRRWETSAGSAVASGPYRPFAGGPGCCVATHRTGLSLQQQYLARVNPHRTDKAQAIISNFPSASRTKTPKRAASNSIEFAIVSAKSQSSSAAWRPINRRRAFASP